MRGWFRGHRKRLEGREAQGMFQKVGWLAATMRSGAENPGDLGRNPSDVAVHHLTSLMWLGLQDQSTWVTLIVPYHSSAIVIGIS